MELISKFESIALEKAIELKNIELDQMAHVFHAIPKEDYHLYNTPDYSHLNQHQSNLDKKLSWLELMGETRFSDWPSKSNINKKSKRKVVSEECKSRRNALKRRKKQLKRVERRVRRVKGEGGVPWVQIMENEFEYLADRGDHGGHLAELFLKKYCS